MERWSCLHAVLALGICITPLAAQDTLPGSRITNQGVVRASAANDSVFISRLRSIDTVDIGDFAAMLLARIGAPRFDDSLAFRVTSDSARVRITGRLMDFPVDSRAEISPLFRFIDSTSLFQAVISMPQADSGIIVFRLEGVTVRGLPIPDLLLLAGLAEYHRRYPEFLRAGGREFHVGIPLEGRARLVRNGIVLQVGAGS